MSIQLFTASFEVDECLEEIRDCLEKGWTGLGYKTVEFEKKWKEYVGLPNAYFVNSATAGLYMAFEILARENGWDGDSEVITTPLTFVSTNHAILKAGLKPVFADVDDTMCLDPKSVREKITEKTKAIISKLLVRLTSINVTHLKTSIKLANERTTRALSGIDLPRRVI